MTTSRERYERALASGDVTAQLCALESLAREALARKEALVAARLADEALALLRHSPRPLPRRERMRHVAQVAGLWLAAARLAFGDVGWGYRGDVRRRR